MESESQFRADLLRTPLVKRLVSYEGVPILLQAGSLAAMLLLVANGWGVGLDETPERLLTLRKTNLTTLVVWGLWWPGMIALAILAGKAWCAVCPMELASRAAHFAGRYLPWPRLAVSRWLRAGWLVVLAYVLLQILVAGLSIHRVPHATALLLLVLLGLAVVAGVAFREERAFCKTLCPARALLSVYGRLTPVQLDVRSIAVCADCRTQDCVNDRYRERFDRRSCPSLIRPFARRPGDDCVLCLQCAKVCSHDNVGFGLVREMGSSRRAGLLTPAEGIFVVVATGFVAHEVIGESRLLEPWFHLVPNWLHATLATVSFG